MEENESTGNGKAQGISSQTAAQSRTVNFVTGNIKNNLLF